jgi:hypothetical protein
LFVGAPGRTPPGWAFLRVRQLEVALLDAEDANDKPQSLFKKCPWIIPIAQIEKSKVKIAFEPEAFEIGVGITVDHGQLFRAS